MFFAAALFSPTPGDDKRKAWGVWSAMRFMSLT